MVESAGFFKIQNRRPPMRVVLLSHEPIVPQSVSSISPNPSGYNQAIGALARGLRERGVDACIVAPGVGQYHWQREDNIVTLPAGLGNATIKVIKETDRDGNPLFLVENAIEPDYFSFPKYFAAQLGNWSEGRDVPVLALLEDGRLDDSGEAKELAALGNYSSVTMGPRIALFTRALAVTAMAIQADSEANEQVIVHGNDHMTAAATYLLAKQGMKTVFTVHNPAYRTGISALFAGPLGIDMQYMPAEARQGEAQPLIDALELAFRHAGMVTTVSGTYAKEIFTYEFGRKKSESPVHYGEILQERRDRGCAFGILNGLLPRFLSSTAKTAASHTQFLFANRLAGQKGWGEIVKNLHLALDLFSVNPKAELRVIADGDPEIAWQLKSMGGGRNNLLLSDYNEALLLEAFARASQVAVMPSIFEPGGLFLQAAQAKGSLGLANPVGGLKEILGEPLKAGDDLAKMVAQAGPAIEARQFGLAFTNKIQNGFWQGMYQVAQMLSRPETRSALDSLVAAAAVRAQAEYTPGRMADDYLRRVYEPLLAPKK